MENLEKLRELEFKEREERLQSAVPQQLIYSGKTKRSLKITYVMTWTGICGGSKIILEHANQLVQRGHEVTLISHFPKPDWFQMDKKIDFIEVPWKQVLCKSIPQCDVIVATYWREIYECIEQKIAPVVYFEQGDYHLFDLDKLDDRTFQYIKRQLETVKYIYTISSFAKEKLKEIYGVDSEVIPNAVNDKVFYYEPHNKNTKPVITIIGAEQSTFKRISNILKAVNAIKNKGYEIELNWITPTEPTKMQGNVIVNPEQIVIGNTLRNTDIYICASIYEAFCLPVLEAMTCGAAVITTNNGGNMDFVQDGINALLVEKDNVEDLIEKIEILINNLELRNKIANNAVQTSKHFSWEVTIDKILDYYNEIAKYQVE